MKYSRLTKEQFETLHEEFAKFLATQSIDQPQWEEMKREKPSLVEEELDLFSDLIWEKTLKKAVYLENTAVSQAFLFEIGTESMQLRVLRCNNADVDLTNSEGWEWALQHVQENAVELMISEKVFGTDREQEIFDLIQQGCTLSDGQRHRQLYFFFKTTKK